MTVTTFDNTEHTFTRTVHSALAFEGYSTTVDIQAHPDWQSANGTIVSGQYLVDGPVPEKWFKVDAVSEYVGTTNFVSREIEASFALHQTVTGGREIFSSHRFRMFITDTGSIEARRIDGTAINLPVLEVAPPGTIQTNQTHYINIRLRGESAHGAGNGAIELWVDGVQRFSDLAVTFTENYPQSSTFNFGTGNWTWYVGSNNDPANTGEYLLREVVLFDSWTNGTFPPIMKVTNTGGNNESVEGVPVTHFTVEASFSYLVNAAIGMV